MKTERCMYFNSFSGFLNSSPSSALGALYAYKVGGYNYQRAFRLMNSLDKIDDLKIPSMPMLYDLDYSRFAKEGKMNHQGYWSNRMDKWLDHYVAPNME